MKSWSRHLGLETVSRPDFDCLALISVSGESGKVSSRSQLDQNFKRLYRGYRGGSPTAVRPSDPALCGSCPLVTPYYCRLGDLLCFMCVYRFVCALLSLHLCFVLFPLFDLSFVDLPSVLWYCWVLWPVKTVSHITYTVLEGTLNTAQSNCDISINVSVWASRGLGLVSKTKKWSWDHIGLDLSQSRKKRSRLLPWT